MSLLKYLSYLMVKILKILSASILKNKLYTSLLAIILKVFDYWIWKNTYVLDNMHTTSAYTQLK